MYNDLPDAMMARVRHFPTLLWLPLTAEQPVVVPDEQDSEGVRNFVGTRRTKAEDVKVEVNGGPGATFRSPRGLPLWEKLPPSLATVVPDLSAGITSETDIRKPGATVLAREDKARAQREREEAKAEKVFAEMDARQAEPVEKIVEGERRRSVELHSPEATISKAQPARPGRWKVRLVWGLVCILVLILLVDYMHPLKPYINPNEDGVEAESESLDHKRTSKEVQAKEKVS